MLTDESRFIPSAQPISYWDYPESVNLFSEGLTPSVSHFLTSLSEEPVGQWSGAGSFAMYQEDETDYGYCSEAEQSAAGE